MRCFHAQGPAGAPTVVLVHGLGNSLDFWTGVAPRISRQFSTFAFDVPGFGESERPPGPFTFDSAAAVVVPLLERLEAERLVVVGHSLGGLLALTIAQRTPAVRRLVLVDATLLTAGDSLERPLAALRHPRVAGATLAQFVGGIVPFDQSRARTLAGSELAKCLTLRPYVHRPNEMDPELLALALAGNTGRSILTVLRMGNSVDIRALMTAVKAPVDLAWGAQDPLLRPEDVAEAARLLRVERQLEIPDCGHWPMLEAPDALSGFITSSASLEETE